MRCSSGPGLDSPSGNRQQPSVIKNCGILPENLQISDNRIHTQDRLPDKPAACHPGGYLWQLHSGEF